LAGGPKFGVHFIKQLGGALRTISNQDFWCDHPGRQRVPFKKGQLTPIHGIVLVEHRKYRLSLSNALPLEVSGVPTGYFTLSDFLNHVTEFRTFTDLQRFWRERHSLANFDRRLTGCDGDLRAHYMLHNGNFPEGFSADERLLEYHVKRADFERFWLQKQLGDDECRETELAARSLRKRAAGYPARRPDDNRYRLMQLALMDLTYSERRLVGRKIRQSVSTVSNGAHDSVTCTNIVMCTSRTPTLAVIIAASKGVSAAEMTRGLGDRIKTFRSHLSESEVLWINVRENSPKYQFVLMPAKLIGPLENSSFDHIPPSWITYTPEARF
jgi:hypothetical protein